MSDVNGSTQVWCRGCERYLARQDFYEDRSKRSGLCTPCRFCKKEQWRARYRNNDDHRERKIQYERERYAKDEAYRQRKNRHARAPARARRPPWDESDREREIEKSRRWSKDNPERYREYRRLYKMRIRGKGGAMAAQELQEMLCSQDGCCAYCESSLDDTFEVDHMLPVSRGGSSSWDNIALTCPGCNRMKADKTPEEFFNAGWL